MGSFSFMYADGGKENQANMVPGDRVRVLIPSIFGGGALNGVYDDYGNVAFSDGSSVDVYELIALWNSAEVRAAAVEATGKPMGDVTVEGTNGVLTPFARNVGIRIACYDDDMVSLSYPLRVVRGDNLTASYEMVEGVSVGDPNQGFGPVPWGDYDLGESFGAYLDELRAQNRRAGRFPMGNVALTDAERERLSELLRMS